MLCCLFCSICIFCFVISHSHYPIVSSLFISTAKASSLNFDFIKTESSSRHGKPSARNAMFYCKLNTILIVSLFLLTSNLSKDTRTTTSNHINSTLLLLLIFVPTPSRHLLLNLLLRLSLSLYFLPVNVSLLFVDRSLPGTSPIKFAMLSMNNQCVTSSLVPVLGRSLVILTGIITPPSVIATTVAPCFG